MSVNWIQLGLCFSAKCGTVRDSFRREGCIEMELKARCQVQCLYKSRGDPDRVGEIRVSYEYYMPRNRTEALTSSHKLRICPPKERPSQALRVVVVLHGARQSRRALRSARPVGAAALLPLGRRGAARGRRGSGGNDSGGSSRAGLGCGLDTSGSLDSRGGSSGLDGSSRRALRSRRRGSRSHSRGARGTRRRGRGRLPTAVARELVPPVAKHPAVKVGHLCGGAGEHDEGVLAGRGPVCDTALAGIERRRLESIARTLGWRREPPGGSGGGVP